MKKDSIKSGNLLGIMTSWLLHEGRGKKDPLILLSTNIIDPLIFSLNTLHMRLMT